MSDTNTTDTEPNQYTLCPACGSTYHEDTAHDCGGLCCPREAEDILRRLEEQLERDTSWPYASSDYHEQQEI